MWSILLWLIIENNLFQGNNQSEIRKLQLESIQSPWYMQRRGGFLSLTVY